MVSLSGFLIAKTGYPALHIFTSSVPLSMAGAGYLHSSPISSKMNPSSQSEKSFSASLIKYPASITSQSAGAQFPFLHGNLSKSIKYISYGIFQGYTDYAEPIGTYSSSGTVSTVTTSAAHNLTTGMSIYLDHTSGDGFDGAYKVTVTAVDTFTVEYPFSRTASGNVSLLPEVRLRSL